MIAILNASLPPAGMVQRIYPKLDIDLDMLFESHLYDSCNMSPPETSVPHLLGTNASLHSEPLANQVRDTFTQVQGDIATLDIRISRLSSTLSKLIEKRERLDEYLTQHQALFSPARRVPLEIWGEIFQYCLSSEAPTEDHEDTCRGRNDFVIAEENLGSQFSSDSGAEDRDTRVPWVFTRISRHLRAAAMSCPRLWTKVSVCVDDYAALDRRRLWPLTRVLRLSGDLPLSITLFGRSYDGSTFDMWTQSPTAQCLAASSQRWERLHLSRIPCPTHNRFYLALRGSLDKLKELKMQFTPELPRRKPLVSDVFAHAPKLRSLTVIGSFPYDALDLPMRQVTSLSMQCILYFPRMIQIHPNLVDLNLTLPVVGVRIDPFTVLRSDHVRTLSLDLHSFDGELTDQLLKSLELPSLSILRLECQHMPTDGAVKFFKTNNTITHLTFRVQKWSEDSLLQSLRSLSSLEQLAVSIWPGSIKDAEPLLNNLARRRRDAEYPFPSLPKLRIIEVISHVTDFPVESFIRLVRARWALGRRGMEAGMLECPVVPLKAVMLYLHGSIVPDHVSATLSKLNDLKDGGLDIRAYAKGLLTPGAGHRFF